MIETQFNVTVGLIIRTAMQLDLITKIMEISPSKIIQNFNEYPISSETEYSGIWVFRKQFKQQKDVDSCIEAFFECIPNIKEKVRQVNYFGNSTLRISLVSEYGQIGFSLSPNNQHLLSEMDMPFEVSIFSYGMCIDE